MDLKHTVLVPKHSVLLSTGNKKIRFFQANLYYGQCLTDGCNTRQTSGSSSEIGIKDKKGKNI